MWQTLIQATRRDRRGAGARKLAAARRLARPGAATAGVVSRDGDDPDALFEVWFVRAERLVRELRAEAATSRVATAALEALLAGPTRAERASGATTAVSDGTRLLGVSVDRGVATVDLTSDSIRGCGPSSFARAWLARR
jgi:hypothetical protein